MPTNEITTGRKTVGNFTIEYQQRGYGGCIPVIDGQPQPSLMFGYSSETDRVACMELLENALRAAGNNIPDVQRYILDAVQTAAKGIHPDEAIAVGGDEVLLSYANRKAYYHGEEIANLDDLTCELPQEAVKALLVERACAAIDNEEFADWD